MNIEITCPICSFSKMMPMESIPADVKWIICPSCKHRFEFNPSSAGSEGAKASPWERRAEVGLWNGIYQTFKEVLFTPGRFFADHTSGQGIREPMAFGILLGSLGYMMGFFWDFLLISGGIIPNSGLFSQIPVNLLFLLAMIISPVLVLLNMFITAAIIHVLMLILNGGKTGFEGTFKVLAFGQATKALNFIPFLGGFVGWFWNIVVTVIGLKEIHGTTYLKVISAIFICILMKCIALLPIFLLKSLFEAFGILQ
jgi:hypothetical protein